MGKKRNKSPVPVNVFPQVIQLLTPPRSGTCFIGKGGGKSSFQAIGCGGSGGRTAVRGWHCQGAFVPPGSLNPGLCSCCITGKQSEPGKTMVRRIGFLITVHFVN